VGKIAGNSNNGTAFEQGAKYARSSNQGCAAQHFPSQGETRTIEKQFRRARLPPFTKARPAVSLTVGDKPVDPQQKSSSLSPFCTEQIGAELTKGRMKPLSRREI